MANAKILAAKQVVIDEIKDRVQASKSVILFDYRGFTDNEAKELRIKLRENNADYIVYKNTLMARALSDLNIDIDASLVGPSAMAFGEDQIAAVKVLADFAKTNQALVLKVGIVDGEKAVSEVKAGRVEYRTDSFGNVHGIIGNTDFTEEKLVENMDAFMATLLKVKPATVKGEYIKNISVSSTMGPGIKVSVNSFDK